MGQAGGQRPWREETSLSGPDENAAQVRSQEEGDADSWERYLWGSMV
jgi:hypothetical protein